MIHYEGRAALVTGAASGIGAALARALCSRGARVLCADRNADGARQTPQEIRGGAEALLCDLSAAGAAGELIDRADGRRHQDPFCLN